MGRSHEELFYDYQRKALSYRCAFDLCSFLISCFGDVNLFRSTVARHTLLFHDRLNHFTD